MNTLISLAWKNIIKFLLRISFIIVAGWMAVTGLHAQTPTPVPQYFYEWTGAADTNFFNANNWSYSGTTSVPSTPAVPPSGPTTSINLPLDSANKTIDYIYNGTGTQRFTFYSIQSGVSKTYNLNFSGNENGWLEINPVGKGFAAAGNLAAAQNPSSNGSSSSGRNQSYITLNSYTRLVLDGSLSSLIRDENGLTGGIFTLRGNAQMDVSKAGQGGFFVQSNSTFYAAGTTLQIGGILSTEPGTLISAGTMALNLQSKIGSGMVTNLQGLMKWDTTTTGTDGRLVAATKTHQFYGNVTVMSGTVMSPGTFRLRQDKVEYRVDGLHEGPILIESAAALGGTGVIVPNKFESTGIVQVNKGGILTPAGKGTATHKDKPLTINGNVLLYGILSFDLVTVEYFDRLTINGNLDIPAVSTTSPASVPSLAVGRADSFPLAPGTYQLLTVNGNITGNFDEVNVSLPISLSLKPSWRWVGKTLEVSFEQLPFASNPELAGMYRIVAERVDAIANNNIVNPILFDTLNRQPSAVLFKDVLYQLSPSTYQAWYPSALFRTNSMVQNIDDMEFQDAAYNRKMGSLKTFLQGYRLEASRARNEMATYSNYGTIAVMVGADYAFGEDLVAGAFLLNEQNNFDLDTEGGKSNADSYTGGVKARFTPGKFQFNLAAFYGTDDYESKRTVAKTNLSTWADADTSGSRIGAAFSAAYTIKIPWFEITPTAGIQWLNWEADAFQESNGNDANLYVYKQKETSFESKVGMRIARSIETKYGHIRPFFQYVWIHEFKNDTRTISADLFGGRIDINAPGGNSDGYRLDFGLDFDIGRNFRMDLRYTGEYKTVVDESRGFRAGVTWTF